MLRRDVRVVRLMIELTTRPMVFTIGAVGLANPRDAFFERQLFLAGEITNHAR